MLFGKKKKGDQEEELTDEKPNDCNAPITIVFWFKQTVGKKENYEIIKEMWS